MLSVRQNPVDVTGDDCELFFEETDNLDATVNLTLKPHSITLLRLNSDVMSAYVTEPEICSNTTTTIKLYGFTPSISFTDNTMQGVIYPTDFEGTFLFDPQGIAGVYSILFADNNSNSVQVTVTVHEAPDLILNYSVPQSICPPLSNPLHFNASVTTTNPNPVISYVWTPTQFLTNHNGQPDAYYLPDTTIEVIVYASDGRCWVSSSDNVIRVDSDKPQFTIDDDIIACTSNSGLVLSVQPNQASNYTYLWSDNSTTAQITAATVNPGLQVYTVTVTGINACSVSHEVKIRGVECCAGITGDVAIYPDNANHYSTTSDLTTAISIACQGCVTSTPTLDEIDCSSFYETIYINGRHRVTKNVNLKNCSVKFGEEAEVIVMPVSGPGRRTLFVEGGNFSGCTQQLWNRIYASGEKTAVIFNNYSSASSAVSIAGARTAIDLTNHAEFGFHNVNFSNNKTHVSFRNFRKRVLPIFTLPAPARYFTNCTLSCSTPGFTDYAVFFENCTDFIIGRPNQSGGNNTLEISGSRYGVFGRNATVNIRNTYLHDITRTAIHLQADYPQDDHRLTVGSSGSRRVKIERCPFGIFAYGDINLNISGNNSGNNGGFHEISNIAIQSFNNNSKAITITENQFTQFNRGVYVYNTGRLADNTVSYNTFNGTLAQPNEDRYAGTAISFVNPMQGIQLNPAKVFGNSITNARIGIHGMNMTYYHVAFDPADPLNPAGYNNINFNLSSPPILYHAGIWLQNCPNAFIANNSIVNTSTINATNFRGIDIISSTGCQINCNTIDKLPRSVYFAGDCNFSNLRLNEFKNFVNGVELFDNNAILPDQGEINPANNLFMAYDNKWIDGANLNERVHRANAIQPTPINWYYDGTAIHDPEPSNTVFQQFTTYNCACDCATANRETDRNKTVLKVINDSIPFDEYFEENAYMAKMNVFHAMKNDSAIIYQNKPDDYIFENFYNAMLGSNMNLLDSVSMLANDSNITFAIIINELINDTNAVESYFKTVNEIYLSSLAQEGELTAADSSVLDMITELPLRVTGNAKFMAAAMLRKEVHEWPSSAGRMQPSNSAKEIITNMAGHTVVVKPNPASHYIFISSPVTDQFNVRIYDALGRLSIADKTSSDIDIRSLTEGVYSIFIFSENSLLHKQKLIVINKQK